MVQYGLRSIFCELESTHLSAMACNMYFEIIWWLIHCHKFQELRTKCQKFASDLLNHTRSSTELEILLNYNVNPESRIDIKAMRLDRLKLAIKLKQKEVGMVN